MEITNGGLVQSLNNISMASFPTAQSTVNVTGGAGGQISQLTAGNDLAVGGFATIDAVGGTALLSLNNAGSAYAGNQIKVYAGGTVDVNPGGQLETNRLHVMGHVDNEGVVNIGGSTVATNNGDLVVGASGQLVLDGGTVRSTNVELDPAATIDLRDRCRRDPSSHGSCPGRFQQ
jgi:hypothetical protein